MTTKQTAKKRYRARGSGSIFKPKNSRFYWIAYVSNGKRCFESSGCERKGDAQTLLTNRLGDIGKGVPVTPQLGKKTIGEGLQAVLDDQELNARRSVDHTRRRITLHLLAHFAPDRRLNTVTTADLTAYVKARRAEGASAASCNLELAIVARAFSLAVGGGELLSKPKIPKLKLSNVRTGFFEHDQFEAVRAALPEELRGVVTLAYFTGWRVASEILPLTWAQVDRAKQVIRLEVGSTKNTEGRTLPYALLPELATVIDAAWAAHGALAAAGTICPFVFHRDGKEIRSLKAAWRVATVAAGCPGRLLHDFRRTAVRNLVRAGVPEKTAMGVTGHKTRSVFDRYDIVNEADLRAALGRLTEPVAAPRSGTVRAFRKRER
jgi:integrase